MLFPHEELLEAQAYIERQQKAIEFYENALREIDNHIRATGKPMSHIVN